MLPGDSAVFQCLTEKYGCVLLSLKSVLCQSLIGIRNFSEHLCQEKGTKIYLQLKYYKCVVWNACLAT